MLHENPVIRKYVACDFLSRRDGPPDRIESSFLAGNLFFFFFSFFFVFGVVILNFIHTRTTDWCIMWFKVSLQGRTWRLGPEGVIPGIDILDDWHSLQHLGVTNRLIVEYYQNYYNHLKRTRAEEEEVKLLWLVSSCPRELTHMCNRGYIFWQVFCTVFRRATLTLEESLKRSSSSCCLSSLHR